MRHLKQSKPVCTPTFQVVAVANYNSLHVAINHDRRRLVNVNRLPLLTSELSVTLLASKEKSSKCLNFFGKLIHTKDGKRKHIACDKVFCGLCLKKTQELPKLATIQLQKENVNVDDPLSFPAGHELFGRLVAFHFLYLCLI